MNTRDNSLATSKSSAKTVNTNRLGATKKADVDTVDTAAICSHSACAGEHKRKGCQRRQRGPRYRGRSGHGNRGFNLREAASIVEPSLLDRLPPERPRDEPMLITQVAVNLSPASQQKQRLDDAKD